MSVGIILTGETLLPVVRPAQEDTAPTHAAQMVVTGFSKASLGMIGKWIKVKRMSEQIRAKRDPGGGGAPPHRYCTLVHSRCVVVVSFQSQYIQLYLEFPRVSFRTGVVHRRA